KSARAAGSARGDQVDERRALEIEQLAHLVEQPSMRAAFAVEGVAGCELFEEVAVAGGDDIADAGGGVGMLLEQAHETLAVHLDHFEVGERAYAGGARLPGHQGHLAGDVAARVICDVANLAV